MVGCGGIIFEFRLLHAKLATHLDGAGLVEVQIRLQKVLRSLAASDDRKVSAAAKRHSRLALTRAEKALAMEHEIDALRVLAEETRQF
jgi:uncharacterized membrane protein